MKFHLKSSPGKVDVEVVPLTEEMTKVSKDKEVKALLKSKDFTGKYRKTIWLRSGGKRTLLVGLGKQNKLDEEAVRRVYSIVVSEVLTSKYKSFSTSVPTSKLKKDLFVGAVVESCVLTDYKFSKFKKKKEAVDEVVIVTKDRVEKIVKEKQTICENTLLARDWVNMPADVMNPVELTKVAKEVARKAKLKITVIDKDLKKKGLNLIDAVGKGSIYPPRMVILEYWGDNRSKKPIALVGKGITFDTGGINLKPTGYIESMKSDKGGACTVLAVMKTMAELKVKKNVIGFMSICENMVGRHSYRPSDIIKSYSGKTVEILNTDAEGRLAMADALTYAEKHYKPEVIVDLATLTGAALVALGEYVIAMVSDSDKYSDKMFKAGQKTFERVWRLPLYEEYLDLMKGDISDIKNISSSGAMGGRAGTITAAAFLKKFIEKTPWVHLDIAGAAWYTKQYYYAPKDATGIGVRLMTEFIRNL